MNHYELDANEEILWVYSASSLWKSANILLAQDKKRKHVGGAREPFLFPVSFMLVGFAIENLIKAILAKDKRIVKGDQIRKSMATHDLSKLFSHIGFELNSSEREVVNILTVFSKWAGRYPIPKSADKMIPYGLYRIGRNVKKNSRGVFVIDKNSEYVIEPDIYTVSQGLLKKLKDRILPGPGFDYFE